MSTVVKEVKIIRPNNNFDNNDKLRVAAYCRVSTDSKDQLNSFYAQMKYYTDYVRNNEKMILVDIYADEGITGTEMDKRDEFKRLIRDCKLRKIDRVLVKSVTRFARNSLECIETVRQMQSSGVSVLFENDNIDTDRMNSEMMLYIKSAFAQAEAENASRRMAKSNRMRMEEGTFVPPSVPFGYKLINNVMTIIPEEAEIVKEIYNMYLSGAGILVICNTIKKKYPKTAICQNGISYILSNEKYTGNSLWQKSYTPNVIPFTEKPNKGELPKFYCEATHEGFISQEDFDAVQRLKEQKAKKSYKNYKAKKEFLYGKIKCFYCGCSYKAKKERSELYWTCNSKGKKYACKHSPDIIDKDIRCAFIDMYNKLKQNEKKIIDETISQIQTAKSVKNKGKNEISEIDSQIAELCIQNDTYTKLHSNMMIDDVLFYEKSNMIKNKITELRSRRFQMLNEDEEETSIENLKQLKREIDNGQTIMYNFDEDLFNKIVNKIIVNSKTELTFELIGELNLKTEIS